MRKVALIIALFLMISLSAAPSIVVDTDSEWDQGTYSENTTSDEGFLQMPIFGPEADWEKAPFPNRKEDVEHYVESSNHIYVAGNDSNGNGAVWKYHESGSLEEKFVDSSTDKIEALEVDADNVYAGGENNKINILDKTDLSKIDDFDQPTATVSGLDSDSNYLYSAESYGHTIRKYEKSTGNQEWSKDLSNNYGSIGGIKGVEVGNNGNVYVAANKLVKLDSNGNILMDTEDFSGRYYSVETNGDGKVYAVGGETGSGFWARYDKDLNKELEYLLPDRAFDLDLSQKSNSYVATTYGDDRTYKIDDEGNLLWVEQDPESQLGVESHSTGAYSVGLFNNIPEGVITRFREVYPDTGDYSSEVYGSSGIKYWDELDLTTQLNGETANLEVIFSNSSSFSSTSTQTFNDISEDAVIDLGDEAAEYARVDFTLSTNDEIVTPRIDSFSLTYSDNKAPEIDSYSPSDGYTADKDADTQTLSVDVSDADGDTMYVTFYDDGGDQIGSTKTINGGSGSASVDYTGLSEGNRYDWTAEVTDTISTASESYYFNTESDNLAEIRNPNPTDGSTVNPGTKTVSVDVEDVDGDDTVVEFYNDTGNFIGSSLVTNGGPETVSNSYEASEYDKTYNWEVVAYQQGDTSKSTSKSYTFTTSSNPGPVIDDYSPSDGASLDKDKTSQTISVDVSDPNGDDLDVVFEDSSGNQIGSVQTVTGGSGSASVSYTGLSEGNRYDWDVEVTDGTSTVGESHHFFTASDQLPVIDNNDPLNGTQFTPGEVYVTVDVEDPDGDNTVVEIYNDTDDYIGGKTLGSGGPQNVNVSYNAFNYDERYDWKVVAYRSGDPSKKTTKAYYFETAANPKPLVTDYYPSNGTKKKPGNFERNVTIDDPNDDSPIDVTFYEGGLNPGDEIGSDQVYGGSGTARVSEPAKGNGNSFEWYAVIDDGSNTVTKVYNYNTFADSAPEFSEVSPKDNVTITASPVELSVFVKDDFASNIDIEFEDDNGNTIKDYTIGNNEYANASYPVMTDETSYNWTVIAEDDKSQTNSSEYRFYYNRPPFRPVKTSIESNYTDIIMTESSSTVVPFKITNPSSKKDLNISIQGDVEAYFVDGGTFKRTTMNQGTRTFLVEVSPDSAGDNKELSLQVENLDYGTFTTDTKNVFVEESEDSFEQVNVPGIGIVQIYSLMLISTLAYFALL